MMKDLCVLVLLGINAWTDHKKREISLGSLCFFSVFSVLLYKWGEKEWDFWQLLALLPGLVFLLTAVGSKGKVGIGDGLLVLVMGFFLSLEEMLWVIFSSLTAAALYSGILFKRYGEKADLMIPYAPFLLLGYVGGLWLWM